MKRWGKLVVLLLVTAFSNLLAVQSVEAIEWPWSVEQWNLGGAEGERSDGGYFTIVDEAGVVLDETAHQIALGDQIINEDNKVYELIRIEGDRGTAKLIGEEQMVWKDSWDSILYRAVMAQGQRATGKTEVEGPANQAKVAIYHTHSDESYVPSDGQSSIYGNGGIFAVGDQLQHNLANANVQALHSKKAHDPHDPNAYHRSRRTAIELLKNNPAALIDVHRDATPPQYYAGKLRGEDITKIKLVVGRSNPKFDTNMTFAKRMKAVLDKTHPGLIKSIYVGKGNYNQDLSPHAMLLEVGAHTNSRQAAENGVGFFADAVPTVLGIERAEAAQPGGAQPTQNRSNWTTAIVLLLIAGLGGGAFLLISTGSFKGSYDKLRQLGSSEWANFLGRLPRRRGKK